MGPGTLNVAQRLVTLAVRSRRSPLAPKNVGVAVRKVSVLACAGVLGRGLGAPRPGACTWNSRLAAPRRPCRSCWRAAMLELPSLGRPGGCSREGERRVALRPIGSRRPARR